MSRSVFRSSDSCNCQRYPEGILLSLVGNPIPLFWRLEFLTKSFGRGYSLFVVQPDTKAFPSQCTSIVSPGQSLSYLGPLPSDDGVHFVATTTTVQSSAVTVFGIPVNGFNVAQSTTSGPDPGTTASTTATNSAVSSSTGKASPGLSTGATAGVAIGVVIAVLALGVGAFLLWRRRSRRSGMRPLPPLDPSKNARQQHPVHNRQTHELYGEGPLAGPDIYELPGRQG